MNSYARMHVHTRTHTPKNTLWHTVEKHRACRDSIEISIRLSCQKLVGSFRQFLTHLETSETAANDKKKTNIEHVNGF